MAVPNLIVMYNPVQWSLSGTLLDARSVVTPQAYWLRSDQLKILRSRFDVSWLLSSPQDEDIWQAGFSLPWEGRCYYSDCSRLSLVQIEAYAAYEWLAEAYNETWHPQVISWFKAAVPSQDLGVSSDIYLDRGLVGRSLNLGIFVRKTFNPTSWDGFFVQQVGWGLPSQITSQGVELLRDESYAYVSQVGVGYSIGFWRWGAQWIHFYSSSWRYSSSAWGQGNILESQVDTLQIALSYSGWSVSSLSVFIGRDDLLGYPVNTTLFHSWGMLWQYRP